MHLIVTAHLRAPSPDAAAQLASAVAVLSDGAASSGWADGAHGVWRAQFRLRVEVLGEPFGSLFQRLHEAAGPLLQQLIVVTTSEAAAPAAADAEPGHTAILRAPPPATGRTQFLAARGATNADEPTQTEIPQVVPPKLARAKEGDESEPIAFAVRAAAPDGLHGFVVATGQQLLVQTPAPWDVVEGEVIVFRPTKVWRFARSSLATGELLETRLEPALHGRPPLALVDHGGGRFELERPALEGDPDDPQDDPIADAREALRAGQVAGALKLLRSAVDEDVRCLEAHDLLAQVALAQGQRERAARHDAVLLAFALAALSPGFQGSLPRELAGNLPLHAALVRRGHDPAANATVGPLAELLARWRQYVR